MKLCVFTGLFFAAMLQDVRYKPAAEFDIKLNYEFKTRVINENSAIYPSEPGNVRRTSTSVLPYLGINLTMVKLQPEEVRLRIITNTGQSIYGRKVKEGDIAQVDMGFTDDMKDRVSPHEYTFTFLTADRREVSRIVMTVGEDGTFLVNNEKRGKF